MRNRSGLIRKVAIGLGVLFFLAAGLSRVLAVPQTVPLYLSIAGVLIVGSALSIRDTGRQEQDQPQGCWEMTGERFRDPATGHLMEIRHNSVTKERDYVDLEPDEDG
ncbi:MAG TPA: hypothetical protein VMW62_17620 [Chloroflexota bacterium]|nr:hypothetical protein [Chloroflexota bacterium]